MIFRPKSDAFEYEARNNKIAKASEMAGQEIDRLSDPVSKR